MIIRNLFFILMFLSGPAYSQDCDVDDIFDCPEDVEEEVRQFNRAKEKYYYYNFGVQPASGEKFSPKSGVSEHSWDYDSDGETMTEDELNASLGGQGRKNVVRASSCFKTICAGTKVVVQGKGVRAYSGTKVVGRLSQNSVHTVIKVTRTWGLVRFVDSRTNRLVKGWIKL